MKTISIAEVEYVAVTLAKKFLAWDEPIPDFSSRYPNRLESCLAMPFQRFSRKDLYKGLISKASILFYLMVKNHPFENGNKRIAMVTLLYFLSKNNKWLRVDNQTLYNFAKWVASSDPIVKDAAVNAIEKFLTEHVIHE